MKAFVDADACISCEMCVETCPTVFKMERDTAIAYVDPVPADAEDCCRQAADECPVEAIKVTA